MATPDRKSREEEEVEHIFITMCIRKFPRNFVYVRLSLFYLKVAKKA